MPRKLRFLGLPLGMLGGFAIALYSLPSIAILSSEPLEAFQGPGIAIVAAGTVIGGLLGLVLVPAAVSWIWQGTKAVENLVQKMPVVDIVTGSAGLIIGLIIANLFGAAFRNIPGVSIVLPTVGSVVFGYLGITIALKKHNDIVALLGPGHRRERTAPAEHGRPMILDTSVIIDGRIADIASTGFLDGTLIIPSFVLEELRHIADSSDMLKRNRGRRGLDILNRIQQEARLPVQIYERDFGGHLEVDNKLIRLARILNAPVVTNDYNLNKVASLQGVQVLNVNDLANALKPMVIPGEEMVVQIIRDGKEPGQGVGYLDDGTMIVVDGGKRYAGETVEVTVTSVLQTSAGRMIFARPSENHEAARVAP